MEQDSNINKVYVDLIEFDDYVYYYEDQPYTGHAYELYPDNSLRSELSFYCGLPDGSWRDWYSSGQLSGEDSYKLGLHHGLHKEWFPNGDIKSEKEFEYGICLWSRKWNENNECIEEYTLNTKSTEYKELETMRIENEKYFNSLLKAISKKRFWHGIKAIRVENRRHT